MTGLIAIFFGIIFFLLGGIVIGGVLAWIAYGMGYDKCENKYGKKSDFTKKEVITYEKQNSE